MWRRLLLMCWFVSMVSSLSSQDHKCQDDTIQHRGILSPGANTGICQIYDLSGLHKITCFEIHDLGGHHTVLIGNGLESNDSSKHFNITERVATEGSCHCLKCETPLLGRYVTVNLSIQYKMHIYSQKLKSPKMELVKENKTWNDAVDHCRDQDMELVTILDREKQAWVELELSKANITSVWLGLRYTCTLDFWFWVSDNHLDFRNWAGNDEENKCGMSAAMKAQEDYRWVKTNEDRKFNFICEK